MAVFDILRDPDIVDKYWQELWDVPQRLAEHQPEAKLAVKDLSELVEEALIHGREILIEVTEHSCNWSDVEVQVDWCLDEAI